MFIFKQMNIPTLLLVFNRPHETQILIKRLSHFKPKKIYIFSDGPRDNYKLDIDKCNKVKKIIEGISWKCEIKKNYLKKNLGCKKAVSKGISWLFKYEEKGIILEDDCIPSRDFFDFCRLSLKKFRNDNKIGSITGNNFLNNRIKIKNSYYFSKYAHCWGWATWRNRWKLYDIEIGFWNDWKKTKYFENLFNTEIEKNYWLKIFNNVKENKIDSWAYPWNLCLWYHGKLVVIPKFNLVKNIWYGKNATRTYLKTDNLTYKVKKMKKPYNHEYGKFINQQADNYVFKNHFKGKNYLWPYRLFYIIKIILTNPRFFMFKFNQILRS
jgi:hypothetical protein